MGRTKKNTQAKEDLIGSTYGKNVQKLDMNAQFWSLMPDFER